MTQSGDKEFGLRNFSEALMKDELMTDDTHHLFAYGLYLANGGTPDKFQEMTMDDVNIMYTSMLAMQKRQNKEILEGLVVIMKKILGGRE